MITKLTSVKTVIAKVIADLNLQEDDIRISDFREWAGEAIEKIGAIQQFERKVSGEEGSPILEIKDHQVGLPCDLHKLHQVAYSFNDYNGPWLPMRKSTGSFSVWGSSNGCKEDKCKPNILIKDQLIVDLIVDMFGDIDKTEALKMANSNQNMKTILTNLINDHTLDLEHLNGGVDPSYGLQYMVKPGYIMTNARSGYLKLSYSAIPTDGEGYPLIPDHASYLEAIYWYITVKYMYPKMLNRQIDRRDYYDMRNSWNFYCKQAYAEAMLPNEDEMESIKNEWNKLYPEMNEHASFYSHVGQRQVIYNASR